jgi:hypothetical protein
VAIVAGSEVELPADPADPLVLDGAGGEVAVEQRWWVPMDWS